MKYIASVSFGKDSLAMLLKILEKRLPLDEVVFFDSGMEFGAVHRLKDYMKPVLESVGVPIVELQPRMPFLFSMTERKINKKDGTVKYGRGWCGGGCRWMTSEKMQVIRKYSQHAINYVGLASDEKDRLNKLSENKISPLADAGMTESDCLEFCRAHGFNWLEGGVDLYDVLDRVSCWCCRNKTFAELSNMQMYLPEYWERLKNLQDKIEEPFKKREGLTVRDLEYRFAFEREWATSGKKKGTKDFHKAMEAYIASERKAEGSNKRE